MNPYRKRILAEFEPLLRELPAPRQVLDFGCGDGWFATQMAGLLPGATLTAIDVKRRDTSLIEPVIYAPGDPLPFADASFDLAYAIDVLHHCDSPERYLDELSRVSRSHLLIKDHVQNGLLGFATLSVLDELGNRRFGIPSPQHYQRGWAWTVHLESRGWQLKTLIHPAKVHVGLLGALTNSLQYIALYERGGAKLQSR